MDKMREEFEKWCLGQYPLLGEQSLSRCNDTSGDYVDWILGRQWRAWQAAWELRTPKDTDQSIYLGPLFVAKDIACDEDEDEPG
jgi:hypothetical protein